MEYRNELVEEGIGKLVYVRAMGAGEGPDQEHLQGLIEDPSKAFSAPLQTATWLARLDGYDAVAVSGYRGTLLPNNRREAIAFLGRPSST